MSMEPSADQGSDRAGISQARLWWIAFAAFTVLYAVTCQRGVDWGNSGMLQLRVAQVDLAGDRGLSGAHALYVALAQPLAWLPIGGLPWRVSLFSGLGMAVALANLTLLATRITGSWRIGALVAAMLATAQTPWLLSAIPEVYTWVVAGLTTELLLLWRLADRPTVRDAALLGLVNGLGFSLHNFALLPFPVYVGFVLVLIRRGRLPWRAFGLATAGWLVGAGLFLVLIFERLFETGDVVATVRETLVGQWGADVLNAGFDWRILKWNLPFLAMNFLGLLGPLLLAGLGSLRRVGSDLARCLLAITALHVIFVIRYRRPDMFTFALPSLVMLTVIAAVGAAWVRERSERLAKLLPVGLAATALLQPLAYALGPWAAETVGVNTKRARQLPYRDDLRYWLVPWKHDEGSADRFVEEAFALAGPDGVIVGDGTPWRALRAYRHLNRPRFDGVTLVSTEEPGLPGEIEAVRDRTLWIVAPAPGYTPDWLLEGVGGDEGDVLRPLRIVGPIPEEPPR